MEAGCDFFALEPFFFAEEVDLFLLGRQAVDGFGEDGCVFFLDGAAIGACAVGRSGEVDIVGDHALAGDLAQDIVGLVAGDDKEVGFEVVDFGEGMALEPDLEKSILHDFFGKGLGLGEFEGDGVDLVAMEIEDLGKGGLIAGGDACKQGFLVVYGGRI